jgi:hypothetical protein
MYAKNSTQRAGAVLEQMDFIPKIAKRLQEDSEGVIAEFGEIWSCSQCQAFRVLNLASFQLPTVTQPKNARFAVSGNIMGLEHPKSVWNTHFGKRLPATALTPVPIASDTLSALGKNPAKKVCSKASGSAAQSNWNIHTGRGCKSANHRELLRFAYIERNPRVYAPRLLSNACGHGGSECDRKLPLGWSHFRQFTATC